MNRRGLGVVVVGVVTAVAGCGGAEAPPVRRLANAADSVASMDPEGAVRQLVARFGARMQAVALTAPDSIAASRLQEAYGTLVTPDLLSDWMSRPASAPGQHLSRPSPDHIEVRAVNPASADEYLVSGALVYRASATAAGQPRAKSSPVRLRVRRVGDGAWRISVFERTVTPVDGS
jgi:hypothetical protein